MKKLMVVLAVVAMAMASQAAAFQWKTGATSKIYNAGTTDLLASATAYLFVDGTQETVFAALANSKIAEGSVSSATVSAGAIAQTGFEAASNVGDTYTTYLVILMGNGDFFISDTASTVTAADGKIATTMQFKEKDISQAAAKDASAGYSAPGWYTAVPEPTSGLLMLIGMAGLALRRRRA